MYYLIYATGIYNTLEKNREIKWYGWCLLLYCCFAPDTNVSIDEEKDDNENKIQNGNNHLADDTHCLIATNTVTVASHVDALVALAVVSSIA